MPILIALLEANRGFAELERRRAGWLLRTPIPSLYLPQQRRGMFGDLRTKIADSAVWKDLLWLGCLLPVLGLAVFIIAVTFWSAALALIFHARLVLVDPRRRRLGAAHDRHDPRSVRGRPRRARAVRGHASRPPARWPSGMGSLARGLLAPSERRRVEELSAPAPAPSTPRPPSCSASSATSTTAPRRGSSRSRWTSAWRRRSSTSDPEGARGADQRRPHRGQEGDRRAARPLARHRPAILTDRGLGPALSSIAARNPVEVALDVDLDGRLPAATEAAAYFVAVEVLTNVAKHSGAEHCAGAHRAQGGHAAGGDQRRRRRRRRPRAAGA